MTTLPQASDDFDDHDAWIACAVATADHNRRAYYEDRSEDWWILQYVKAGVADPSARRLSLCADGSARLPCYLTYDEVYGPGGLEDSDAFEEAMADADADHESGAA
jgi:hypothetical protein